MKWSMALLIITLRSYHLTQNTQVVSYIHRGILKDPQSNESSKCLSGIIKISFGSRMATGEGRPACEYEWSVAIALLLHG